MNSIAAHLLAGITALPTPERKPTAGPWHVEAVEGEDEDCTIWGVWHPGSRCGATTVCNVFSKPDAHLIAAAPDMRDALRLLLGHTDIGMPFGDRVAKALAALHKADGL